MLGGTKPLAMFGDAIGSDYEVPEDDFAPYVAEGRIVRREAIYLPQGAGVAGRFVYFARVSEEWRIDAMHRINERLFAQGIPSNATFEREIGRLLGYTESEIDQYLAWLATQRRQ